MQGQVPEEKIPKNVFGQFPEKHIFCFYFFKKNLQHQKDLSSLDCFQKLNYADF